MIYEPSDPWYVRHEKPLMAVTGGLILSVLMMLPFFV